MSTAPCLPYNFEGTVVRGFGRGGKELNCPTANLDDEAVSVVPTELKFGVYYGLARFKEVLYPMAMSFGQNPQFKNEKRSFEVNLIGYHGADFYGEKLKGVILGFIRNQISFKSMEELKEAIANDIEFAKRETADKMKEFEKILF